MRGIPAPVRHAVVGAIAFAIGWAAVAVGAIPGADGTITGCYRTSGGDLRVIDAAQNCRASETRLAWSQQGPAGPTGPQGPRGDPGAGPVYVHANLPTAEQWDGLATSPLPGGDIPGWGRLEGVCVRETVPPERSELGGTSIVMQVRFRNESGGNASVAPLDDNQQRRGQELADGESALLATTSFGRDDPAPPTGGEGATVVRRIDRKLAAFRIVFRLEGDHCEFDISEVLEP